MFQSGRQKAEGKRQKAEGGRRKAEGGRQKAEGKRQKNLDVVCQDVVPTRCMPEACSEFSPPRSGGSESAIESSAVGTSETDSAVVVGADRIAANGDTANKIGTYSVAVLAHEHDIPFYVAAPISTVDLSTPDGTKIPIEQRAATEVTHLAGKRIAPEGIKVENPAFDVTPAKYIAAIITERGVAKAPFEESLKHLSEATAAV